MASRYRYDPDRRSRSPRDRSPDRFDGDRRRPPVADMRPNSSAFQSNRDVFGDGPRREPPRGPRALIDPPSGPRGGFGGDFRGRGRGRGRGWSARDDSRDRGRDRDIDFRDRYRDDRSRERERDRDRDRDWRDSYRSRRSPPPGRVRSPPRDFRDRERERERDGPPGPEADRSRRNSRDGGPPSVGSPSSDSPFNGPPLRGGGFGRGRGRGGRGDWGPDRTRGRMPYDDRGDRYPRSRSQEGRWGRERDDRDRGDRYPEADLRRDPRDDRDRAGDRDLFRAKMEARTASVQQEPASQTKEVSPPPVAPSAPAFGAVPNRADGPPGAGGTGKAPPTAPRAFGERQAQAQELPNAPMGLSKSTISDGPSIPVGPRAQQQKGQRPSSKQWINPNLKKAPDSPKMMRGQSFQQPRPGAPRRDNAQVDHFMDERRPRSSDGKAGFDSMDTGNRRRSHHSAEPGEITSRSEDETPGKMEPNDRRTKLLDRDREARDGPRRPIAVPVAPVAPRLETEPRRALKEPSRCKRKHPIVKAVRFAVPPKPQLVAADRDSESDDDEDLADYFKMQIEKTEAELNKLQRPKLPLEVVARFASMSHGAMVKILSEKEGLEEMLGEIPEGVTIPGGKEKSQSPVRAEGEAVRDAASEAVDIPEIAMGGADEATSKEAQDEAEAESRLAKLELKPEEMEVDGPSAEVPAAPKIELEATDDSATVDEPTTAVPHFTSTDERVGQLPSAEQILPATHLAAPMETTEHGSKPLSPPSQVEDEGDEDETESEEETFIDASTVRQYMATPPIDSLPTLDVQPWDRDRDFLSSLGSDPSVDDYILSHLQKVHLEKTTEQKHDQEIYAESYIRYLEFTRSNDPVATKSRDKSRGHAADAGSPATPEAKPEGGRSARRFASERDLERVLQASMREEDERRERELRMQKEKYRGDKEAVIPNMYWNKEEKAAVQFLDTSGYVPVNKLVSAWKVLPPVNNFTQEEHELFEKRYLELPKQWGKVAEAIPNRDFGTCIQYYYLMKKTLNLKEKLKRQPKKRKRGGRGKQRSSALVSELGNAETEGDDNNNNSNNDNGENGENRRRPRRAAAPTWNFEQATESESGTPVGTPGRRGAAGASKGDQPEKVDGRRGRKKGAAKDKDKTPKPNQTLAAAPAPAGRSRSRSENKGPQNLEVHAGMSGDAHRLPTHFEQLQLQQLQQQQQQQQQQVQQQQQQVQQQQHQPAGIQPPFSVNQPHQLPVQAMDRPPPLVSSSIADVMAPPSLRPEPPPPPPPQPAMTTFNLGQTQPQPERKAPTQASSYWSVSESNDFPLLLKAFGSDWTAIAAHMGSKTAVMVKNYYVRQKDQGKTEWEDFVREADSKRDRGEKRPDPPQPSIGGRGKKFDTSTASVSRPLAAALGTMELPPEPVQPKVEAPGQQARAQGYPSYAVPIAQAPQQPPAPGNGQKPLSMQPGQHPVQPVSQAMSPAAAPSLRAPMQSFGFPEREREQVHQTHQAHQAHQAHQVHQVQQAAQRVPLPQKATPSQADVPRHLTSAQPLHPSHPENTMERQKIEILQQQQQRRDGERDRERELERMERDRELARQAERQSMRARPEPELAPQRHYEPLGGHRQPAYAPRGDPSRSDPLSLSRHPQEPPRHGPPQPYQPHTSSQQPLRGLLSDMPPASSPPPLAPPTSRSMSAVPQVRPSGPPSDVYRTSTPQPSTPAPPARPAPEPRKSNIMSLLNDDPPPQPKRVSDVSANPAGPSPPPPPPGTGRPQSVQQPPSQLRRESEPYSPYGRPHSAAASAMPSLKPTYNASPGPGPRSSLGMPVESPSSERDYYRPHSYQPPAHQSSVTDSPQTTHRYPAQPGQAQYQSQAGYPTPYGSVSQPPPASSSPPPQFSLHGSASRPRESSLSSRDSWAPQGHHQPPSSMQQPGSWGPQPPKTSQAPPPSQSWAGQHSSGPQKASTPTGAWATAPPPHQPHPSLRDDRGPPMYGSQQQQQQQQQQQPPPPHQMQGRYAPPVSRGPEPVPPPAQAYPRYASTPGPGPGHPPPRDPRDMPGRSYTPAGYDQRGPPQPPGPGYPGADPRDMQLRDPRDPRDPRDMVGGGLRPPQHQYDRHPDHYGR